MLTLTVAYAPIPARAGGLPQGVSIEVLAEYPSRTPGVEKVLLRRITLAPGATWRLTVPAQSFCQGTKGSLEVVDHTTGKRYSRKTGERWSTEPGHDVTLTNTGSGFHEHLFYTLVPAG